MKNYEVIVTFTDGTRNTVMMSTKDEAVARYHELIDTTPPAEWEPVQSLSVQQTGIIQGHYTFNPRCHYTRS
jgi:hypothetical protein